ncbi:Na+/proline symporter [Belliella baltica DSM 15883]|uniref:Na+/proline symporter n=1 Tax=Belliella baltica (strain DSM 15883 / CIP 108006 / LMG 21964 / BA134) TaxID=866536 RepID=I3Z957_BELBD|nr:sodium:solute symporter family protein [Belliella baltica]AFL85775.1 Na+/proline symporter [Belliella baltica DSM 15883]
MLLQEIDWIILIGFFVISLGIGLYTAKKASKSQEEYFNAGGSMSWWLLGISMVATTFSTDTPNLVTDIVRTNGVAGNWVWWSFLLTGMLTVFFFAKLWKRSGVLTDIEFYEMRYSGKLAAFLRGFRAIYLGVFFNVVIIASVSLAAIKIGGVLLGISPLQTLLIAGVVTVIYSSLGGLRGVVLTDFLQFGLSLGGAIAAAYVAVSHPAIGSMDKLLSHPEVSSKLNILPDFGNMEAAVIIFFIPLFIQWWSVWYPGAEPGGGGYVVQRMLAAKNEKHAFSSVLLFNIVHYAIRPWPWIIVALASIVVFPTLDDIQIAFPNTSPQIIKDDIAYPAMLSFLPVGLMGLVVTSLVAAYMSTLSTHLNWGASYVVNDFYKRFINPESSQKTLVNVGRLATVLIMLLGGFMALKLENALQSFSILLQIGAGTGLLYILRWYWWRINAASELTAMIVSFAIALYFAFVHQHYFEALQTHEELVIGVLITTVSWIVVSYLTKPTDTAVLIKFLNVTKVPGKGWESVRSQMKNSETAESDQNYFGFQKALLSFGLGVIAIFGLLIAIGKLVLKSYEAGGWILFCSVIAFALMYKLIDNKE